MFAGSYDFFIFTALFYAILYLIDNLLKYWLGSSYVLRQLGYGISIKPFLVTWFTSYFNRCIQKFGTWRPKFQKTWFSLGMWITLFGLPIAVYLTLQSTCALFINIVWKETKRTTSPFLKPVVPGVDLPISDVGYYILTVLICCIFHELGHAIAAVREGIHITGVGLVLFFIFPVAYVQMEGTETLSAMKQLRVCCAGVWHNIVLTFFAYLILLFLPWFSYPFYEYGNGVQVTSIHKNSPLQAEGGLEIDEIILGINKCRVTSQDTWVKCIYQVAKNPVLGYCVTSEFVHENDESVRVHQQHNIVECCRNDSLSKICFEYLEKGDNPLELPQYSCLKARLVVEQSTATCTSADDCAGLHCFRPSLANGTKFIEIERKDQPKALFLGYPNEILKDVHISEYINTTYFTTTVPNMVAKFCNFLIMFSAGIAVLNLIPCFFLDGQHITRLLVNICFGKNVRFRKNKLAVSLSFTILGSFVLVIYTFLTFYSMFITLSLT